MESAPAKDVCTEILKTLEQYQPDDTAIVDELLRVLSTDDPDSIVPTVKNLISYANKSS